MPYLFERFFFAPLLFTSSCSAPYSQRNKQTKKPNKNSFFPTYFAFQIFRQTTSFSYKLKAERLQVGSLTYLWSLHEQNFQDQAIKTAARNGRITAGSERSV